MGAIPTAMRSTTLMSLQFLPPTQRMQALVPPKAMYEFAMDQGLGQEVDKWVSSIKIQRF